MIEPSQQQATRARLLCAVAVLAILMATLWPFNPFLQNGVHWAEGENGLRFKRAGVVFSRDPLKLPESDHASYTLELLLKPSTVRSSHTILGFYVPSRRRHFQVCQWTDGLIVTHDAMVENDRTRTIKFDVDHAFRPGTLVLITISSGPHGTAAYLNGQRAAFIPTFRISHEELAGEVSLGTSPTTYDPWPGEVRGLAVYAKELSPAQALQNYHVWANASGSHDLDSALALYTFAEGKGSTVRNAVAGGPDLEIPAAFQVPHKAFLQPVTREFRFDHHYGEDVLMNIAGFVPLGLIVCSYLNWRRNPRSAILASIVFCGALSFMIEVLQYYIPRRASGTTDIITNTLGAAIGAMLLRSEGIRRILEELRLVPIHIS